MERWLVQLEPARLGLEWRVVELESTWLGLEWWMVGLEPTLVGMEWWMVGLEPTLVGMEQWLVGWRLALVGRRMGVQQTVVGRILGSEWRLLSTMERCRYGLERCSRRQPISWVRGFRRQQCAARGSGAVLQCPDAETRWRPTV